MGWITKLAETYDNCLKEVGVEVKGRRTLEPLYHGSREADVEITLSIKGEFKGAKNIPKEERETIIPVTEGSATRSGTGSEPHPLFENLKYIAKDIGKEEKFYTDYIEQLGTWIEGTGKNEKLCAVEKYLEEGTIIANLDRLGIVKEVEKKKEDKRGNVFCRFVVIDPSDDESKVYKDEEIRKLWIEYCKKRDKEEAEEDLCYATGEPAKTAKKHGKFIRKSGDRGKIISSNDDKNFTYNGIFEGGKPEQACVVGEEVSQKAHSALRWLISKQGYTQEETAILAWKTNNAEVPQPINSALDFMGVSPEKFHEKPIKTGQVYGTRLKEKLAGYRVALGAEENVNLISLDSATEGRISINYYREFETGVYLDRLEKWYESCAWIMTYSYKSDDKKGYTIISVGTPTPEEIAAAAFGKEANSKSSAIKRTTIQRLLPCITEGMPLPYDLVKGAITQTSRPMAFKGEGPENNLRENEKLWNKSLEVTCAMVRKYYYGKENYKMTLDENRETRDYLYGRLLAIADNLERWGLRESGAERSTAAMRYFAQFSVQPLKTWKTIAESLAPYLEKLGEKAEKEKKEMDYVVSRMSIEDALSNRPLSGEYLIGYHNQREIFNERKRRGDKNNG